MEKVFLPLLLLLVLASCADKKVDTTSIKKEMKAREVKVIPEGKILQTAMSIGNQIVKELKNISPEENANIGLADHSQRIQQKLSLENVSIRALSFKDETQTMHEKEHQILEAYLYNVENNIPLEANIQPLNKGETLLYTAPLSEDGNAMGMWSIKIPRKTVVLSIED